MAMLSNDVLYPCQRIYPPLDFIGFDHVVCLVSLQKAVNHKTQPIRIIRVVTGEMVRCFYAVYARHVCHWFSQAVKARQRGSQFQFSDARSRAFPACVRRREVEPQMKYSAVRPGHFHRPVKLRAPRSITRNELLATNREIAFRKSI